MSRYNPLLRAFTTLSLGACLAESPSIPSGASTESYRKSGFTIRNEQVFVNCLGTNKAGTLATVSLLGCESIGKVWINIAPLAGSTARLDAIITYTDTTNTKRQFGVYNIQNMRGGLSTTLEGMNTTKPVWVKLVAYPSNDSACTPQ